ncbi:hypothetical protein RUMHYD_01233 [Blautia hydrogenotrophica DSM 10507]|uniref:Uncharacterized protein n=1 Tax=Blautia hydrogenotrophica (strain DSM 10507 / JCM 14656 / S5a33) TaxID=476272 RepID=C0CK63_BLAHS|nr:hypothetical protein RUMHYD_01233 [Blautia hydrogenotrophica DSM 10507]
MIDPSVGKGTIGIRGKAYSKEQKKEDRRKSGSPLIIQHKSFISW